MKKSCLVLLFLFAFYNNAFAHDVIFNTKTLTYHTLSCEWARRCTKNCIKIDHTLAQSRRGVPCKVCGGLEMSSNNKNRNETMKKSKELSEIQRLKDEMAKLIELELERMKTIMPIFDNDYETLHDN